MTVSNCTDSSIKTHSIKESLNLENKQTFEGITTERLHLRAWKDEDIEKIHLIMQDPDVTHYLQHHKLNERATIERLVEKSKRNIVEHGYGYFVCEHTETGKVIGMVGLNYVEIDAPYFPCYTVSWIFGKSFWGKGHATEAAKALINYGFEVCNLSEIYACTTSENKASENVMKRLGMSFKNDFGFPDFKEDDPFYKHVLYVQEKDAGL
jgi:RimJ/RimL family protein N-acetyltransferase